MISKLKRLLAQRTQRAHQRAFDDGYAFAAGVLLKSNGFDDPADYICAPETAFDDGIREARIDWHASTGRPVGAPA